MIIDKLDSDLVYVFHFPFVFIGYNEVLQNA